jgi:ubiquinone biosynthesis protein
MKNEEKFSIPKINWARVSQNVLTMEWIDGVRLDNFDALDEMGLDPKQLLGRAVEIFFLQVFRDGFFHADIHPGNLLIRSDGVLVPVDFGITGRIDLPLKNFLADTLTGFVTRDYERVARAHAAAGYLPKGQTIETLTQACRAIGEPLFGGSLDNVSFAQLMFKVISISDRFELPVQMRLLLLHKTMLQAEGVGQMIDPKLNIWLLSQDLIASWIRKNRSLRKRVRNVLEDFSSDARRVPELLAKMERFLDQNEQKKKKKTPFFYGILCGVMGGGGLMLGWVFLLN